MRRVGPFGSPDGTPFEQGTGNDDGSFVPAAFFTVIREELAHLVEHAGIALSGDDSDLQQVRKAVVAMIAESAIAGLKALAYLDVGQGLEDDGADHARVKLNGTTLLRGDLGLSLNLGRVNMWAAQQSPFVGQALTDAATVVWDINVHGQFAKLTTAAARTIGAPTDMVANTFYGLEIVTGGYTPSWASVYDFGAAGPPAGLTGTCTFIGWYDGIKVRIVPFQTGGA